MSLPAPKLDDRRFQDIVDQAKLLIPHYCREWTDHNVSDPGVTLIELFAWMTDMLLYRVNQVPDKNYIKFLELIGMQLEPPRAATAPITFYLSAAQPTAVTIPADTEVATVRTESSPAIIFTTEQPLTIQPPRLIDTFTRNASQGSNWLRHNLPPEGARGREKRVALFPQKPAPGDAFLLAFENDLSNHLLALIVDCERAGGAGVDPTKPPLIWQVWQGRAARWVNCELEYDGTGGFNEAGEIILHLPEMVRSEFVGVTGYWLRCRLTEAQTGPGSYQVSPVLRRLRVEARGGTVSARHAITVKDEVLGVSDGTPGQVFRLQHTPILALDPQQEYLVSEAPGGKPQSWQAVEDFAESGPQDRHFTLDKLDGTLTFGPALLQPDGTVYRFGSVPEKGSLLVFKRYRYGGGVVGNVARGTLTVLKSAIPYVAHVTNREAAVGGRDAQSLEEARLRAPQKLRARTRAVTADDYEFLACQVPGVARARCLAPGAQPGGRGDPRPGQVFVIVLPQVDDPEGKLAPEQLALSAELRSAVLSYLQPRRLLGTALEVHQPQYVSVSVQAELRVPEHSDPALIEAVQQEALEALRRYLNPYIGGPRANGWPFGRALNRSELYGLLQRIEHVEYVENLVISVGEATGAEKPLPANQQTVQIPRHGLICSGQHQIKVR
ncbi:putative baseplate assembly protein [Thermogemmatispora tikiterensis]|uniref:Putative baseplate assembly protein n=1 Tax=Thermogemmatispora tikiterensis TaxID=1825093 RepID=A0A328VTT2_9CHLR|nr:putative baseplate assembly protein [Thermogemmatispora tikiterensis]RAQ97525.1 putative baseplate assembly protein [Thermogemmatispora tikiterensis]